MNSRLCRNEFTAQRETSELQNMSTTVYTYVIPKLVQDRSDAVLLHDDNVRILPLYETYPAPPRPRQHLNASKRKESVFFRIFRKQ